MKEYRIVCVASSKLAITKSIVLEFGVKIFAKVYVIIFFLSTLYISKACGAT